MKAIMGEAVATETIMEEAVAEEAAEAATTVAVEAVSLLSFKAMLRLKKFRRFSSQKGTL